MLTRCLMIAVIYISLVGTSYVTGAETVTISITEDGFSPAPFRRAAGKTFALLSNERPETIIKEPKYTGTTQWYGSLDLGTRKVKRHYFCFDQQENGQFLLYFDRNKNGDLTDDCKALKNQGSGAGGPDGFGCKVSLPWNQMSDNAVFLGNFDLWLFSTAKKERWAKQPHILYYSRANLSGSVTLEGKKYKALLYDMNKSDGDLTNDGIAIDLNENGKIDVDEHPRSEHEIDGKTYEFKVTW